MQWHAFRNANPVRLAALERATEVTRKCIPDIGDSWFVSHHLIVETMAKVLTWVHERIHCRLPKVPESKPSKRTTIRPTFTCYRAFNFLSSEPSFPLLHFVTCQYV